MNAPWSEFLRALGDAGAVTLVGPMHGQTYNPDQPTVFVDGGAQFCGTSCGGPVVRVGDGDSGKTALDVLLPEAKDFSDLAFALRELPESVTRLKLLGFLGGRRDHELAVFGEVHAFLRRRAGKAELWQGGALRVSAFSGGIWMGDLRGGFSVFVLESAAVSIRGACRYPLAGTLLTPLSSHGLSNWGGGAVEVACERPCFIVTATDIV